MFSSRYGTATIMAAAAGGTARSGLNINQNGGGNGSAEWLQNHTAPYDQIETELK